MLLAVLSIFALAVAAPLVYQGARGLTGWLLALLPLGLFFYFASFIPDIAAGQVFLTSYEWVPALGVNLSFRLDGLALLFALLVTGIGALILIYAGGHMAGYPQVGRFFMFLLLFMASMLGVVLADNLIALFVFWELTSISSYLLIGFNHAKTASRAAALQALLVTGGGGLALLGGLVLLGLVGGSMELTTLLGLGAEIRGHDLYLPVLLLVLIGAFTKSAQVPFHFWLPSAMEAPTPVSAYLHSATMVKAGVYLLARFSPFLSGTDAWFYLVTTIGAVTMVIGGLIALYQTDLKRILAYSTISALGTLVLLLGIGTDTAVKGAVVFLFAHALYKGALFMVAGSVDHETGTRDVEQVGGLRRVMPVTAAVAVLAAVSLSGVGPVLSFIGKEILLEAVLETQQARIVLIVAAVLAGALFVAVAAIVSIRPFFGRLRETPKQPHEAPPSMWVGPALLATTGLLMGLMPNWLAENLVQPAIGDILGRTTPVYLALWHGINEALLLSILSLVGGLVLYRGWAAFRRSTSIIEKAFGWGPARWYAASLDLLNWVARTQTSFLQSGYLRYYLFLIIAMAVGLGGYTLLSRVDVGWAGGWNDLRLYEAGVAVVILAAAAAAARSPSRLAAVIALGIVGYGVALVYILFGAPDLAMTQFAIETLTVILFVLVLYRLPRFTSLSSTAVHIRDMLIAGLAGAFMTVLVLAATSFPLQPRLTPYFAEASYPLAHGRNIVNVILVDFRSMDTLGEIVVLAVAAIGVFALLTLRPEEGDQS